jgi:polyisoprenoid-binding protein YceI
MSTTAAVTTSIPTGTWNLDPVHSSLGFAIKHSGVMTFHGDFPEFDAKLVDGRLEGTAKVASVRVDEPNLAGHLQTPDFFDAEQHPVLRFTATDISLDGENVNVQGDLTIKGVTQPTEVTGTVAAPLTDYAGRERVGLKLTTTVDRTAFGVSWNAPIPSGEPALADDVSINAELFFTKEA